MNLICNNNILNLVTILKLIYKFYRLTLRKNNILNLQLVVYGIFIRSSYVLKNVKKNKQKTDAYDTGGS